jgi:hypothetical protein
MPTDIVLNESPAAPKFCGDPHPCRKAPLQKAAMAPEYRKAPPRSQLSFGACLALTGPGLLAFGIPCGVSVANCGSTFAGNPEGPAGCVQGIPYCSATAAIVAGCYAISRGYSVPRPPEELR